MEIDFTDQIKQLRADKKAGYPPNCNEGYEAKDGQCVEIVGYWEKKKPMTAEKSYPGKNVKRRKDGVPQKKTKKRACKKGEYRDKGGALKKTKGTENLDPNAVEPKDISPEHLESNPNFNQNIEVQETELPLPPTKGIENPRNMNEYYKNLYKKVKGLD
jgi:hypothetical protein